MSRLEELKNEYAFTKQYPTWDDFISDLPVYQREDYYNEITIQYAEECVKASLEKASQNNMHLINVKWRRDKIKEGILNPENIVLL